MSPAILASMSCEGFLFDLDGTLVDTNDLHAEAWRRAFEKFGYRVGFDRIAVEIGKGGDQLLPSILGHDAFEKDGDALSEAHPKEYELIAKKEGIRVFPKAKELVDAIRAKGIKTVLATSSGEKHLDVTAEASGIDFRKLMDAFTTADDAEKSKPAPDLVSAAVKKLKLSPAQCCMLGDTPFDIESAKHAGVACIGLTSGGNAASVLARAGARGIYRDTADVLDDLDKALHRASPTRIKLTNTAMEALIRQSIDAARDGMQGGEIPIGCILADADGNLIARGFNEMNRTGILTAHAEMVTFARAAGKIPEGADDLILVSSLEPCVMCLGASMQSGIDTILYALKAPADSGTGRVIPPESPDSQMPRIVGGILAKESRSLFEEFLKKQGGNEKQINFAKQLLKLI